MFNYVQDYLPLLCYYEFMNKTKPRKRDRRTEYTCSLIKDAVLELLSQKDYGEITVTAICRQTQIGRGTFYLHYDNMRQVMDELFGDAMAQVKDMLVHVGFEPEEDGDCSYPLCRFLREQKKYQALFFSDSLRSEVMDAIYNSGKDHFLVNMRKRVDTSDEILLSLFYFQLNGCLALARKNVDCSNAKWDEIQCSVDRFLTHGLSALGAVDPMNG